MNPKMDDTPLLVAEQFQERGQQFILKGPSPINNFSVVFEDDGETGYLYGLNLDKEPQPILDALLIYNVKQLENVGPQIFQIVWSADGLKAALFIDNFPHGVFDFKQARGYCRSNYPPPDKTFTRHSHKWSDDALAWLEESALSEA